MAFQDHHPFILLVAGVIASYALLRIVQYGVTYHKRSVIIRNNGCKPAAKYPHKDPILGLDIFRDNARYLREGKFLEAVADRYATINGGVSTFTSLFMGDTIINTMEPENIKAILATKFKHFELPQRRKDAFHPIFGHGIFTTDGKEWEDSRALLRPSFVRSQVGDLATFEEHISKLIAKIPKDGTSVDLQHLFFMLTMDSATDFLLGESTDILSDGDNARSERFAQAFTYVQEKAGLQSRVGKLATLFRDKRYEDDIKFVHEYIGVYVRTAIEKGKQYQGSEKERVQEDGKASRYIFLNELAKTGYPAKKIQDEILNILLAGRDTTASLLSQVFYVLARRPDIFEKLRAEVMQLDNSRPSFEQIKDMKYLKACLNEGKQLFASIP